MTNEQLQQMIEENPERLEAMKWELYGENEVRVHDAGYTYFLRDDGRVQVWKGGLQLLSFNCAEFIPMARVMIARVTDETREEFARCFKPAGVPSGVVETVAPVDELTRKCKEPSGWKPRQHDSHEGGPY